MAGSIQRILVWYIQHNHNFIVIMLRYVKFSMTNTVHDTPQLFMKNMVD